LRSEERSHPVCFTIDGEAVVLGLDGLSRFEELSRREAARTAILYAFDLIERDGGDMRNLPFLDRKAAPARPMRATYGAVYIALARNLFRFSGGSEHSWWSRRSHRLWHRGRGWYH
jgi:hypothetical protein